MVENIGRLSVGLCQLRRRRCGDSLGVTLPPAGQPAAERGWLEEKAVVLESLIAIRRAGAGIILTYWAKDVARWLA